MRRGGRLGVGSNETTYRLISPLTRRSACSILSRRGSAIPCSLAPNDLAALRREAQTIARLDHPHILRVLDFEVDPQGIPFLVLEYASAILASR